MKEIRIPLSLILVLAVQHFCLGQMQNRETYLAEFQKRAAFVVSIYDTSKSPGYYRVVMRVRLLF